MDRRIVGQPRAEEYQCRESTVGFKFVGIFDGIYLIEILRM